LLWSAAGAVRQRRAEFLRTTSERIRSDMPALPASTPKRIGRAEADKQRLFVMSPFRAVRTNPNQEGIVGVVFDLRCRRTEAGRSPWRSSGIVAGVVSGSGAVMRTASGLPHSSACRPRFVSGRRSLAFEGGGTPLLLLFSSGSRRGTPSGSCASRQGRRLRTSARP
jgi:hypothetical protein